MLFRLQIVIIQFEKVDQNKKIAEAEKNNSKSLVMQNFTGNNGYQKFLVFAPMLSSLTLDNKVTDRLSTGISPEKN